MIFDYRARMKVRRFVVAAAAALALAAGVAAFHPPAEVRADSPTPVECLPADPDREKLPDIDPRH